MADAILRACNKFRENFRALVACFSRKSDVLSQWRAYADDASGFCIGLTRDAFDGTAADLFEVEYSKEKQRRLIRDHLASAIATLKKSRSTKRKTTFFFEVFDMCNDFTLMKNPAFIEEMEVRARIMTSLTVKENERSGPTFYDVEISDQKAVNYLMNEGRIVPYTDVIIEPKLPLVDIVLGPRNPNSVQEVGWFASSYGFDDVKIRTSTATYR